MGADSLPDRPSAVVRVPICTEVAALEALRPIERKLGAWWCPKHRDEGTVTFKALAPAPVPGDGQDSRVERVAEFLWVKEMRHSDHPNSERAAKRWWKSARDDVRQSWLDHAAAVLAVADLAPASDDQLLSDKETTR